MDFTWLVASISWLQESLPESVFLLIPALFSALLAGGVIGLERSTEGRAAGFRTFSLVALGSALLTAPTVHPHLWHYLAPVGLPPMDPTRVVQGIVTGVGFLGAGVIYKEGYNIRGLTTAACIWVTSAIGVLMGLGLYLVGFLAAGAVLAVLTLFRHIEALVPSRTYSQLRLAYARDAAPEEAELKKMLCNHGLQVRALGYKLHAKSGLFEFEATLVSKNRGPVRRLVGTLKEAPEVASFELSCANR